MRRDNKKEIQLLMIATVLTIGEGIAVTVFGFNAVHSAYNDSVRRATEIRALTEINASVAFAVRLDPRSEYTRKRFADASANIQQWADTLAPMFTREDSRNKLKEFRRQWEAYSKRLLQIYELARRDPQSANGQVVDLFRSDFGPMHDGIDFMTKEVGRFEKAGVIQTESIIVTSRETVTIVLLSGLVVVIAWLFILTRQIVSS